MELILDFSLVMARLYVDELIQYLERTFLACLCIFATKLSLDFYTCKGKMANDCCLYFGVGSNLVCALSLSLFLQTRGINSDVTLDYSKLS